MNPIINWRRNLAALWVAEFTAIFGFSFAFPFLPAFLHRDLGIQDERSLAFWTGVAAGATGFAMAFASPVWGLLADRYGRKPMLLRAMLGAGVTVGLMGLAQTALQLTGLRFILGAVSGTVPAATAIVGSQSPRTEVAWSLGILSSAIALGSAVGPAVGGVAGSVFGLRTVFICGGVLLLVSTIPVVLVVREAPLRSAQDGTAPPLQVLRAAGPGTISALAVLIGGQALFQSSYTAIQQLVALRIVQLDPAAASTVIGITFGIGGIGTALAGVSYSRAVRLAGYRNVTSAAAILVAAITATAAVAPSLLFIVASLVAVSFLAGALFPAMASMIGLETPARIHATIYGVSGSAVSIGFGVGPLMGGLVAASAGVPSGLFLASSIALVLAAIMRFRAREPTPAAVRT